MTTNRNYTDVELLIYSMLTENTGAHFLDSGEAYGRHHERNAKKTILDFYNEEEENYQFDFKYGEIYRTVSVFHYLSNNTELNEICEAFNKLNTNPNNWEADADVYGVCKEAWEYLEEVGEAYGLEVERTWNTYNGDSDLSQTLQGSNIKLNDEYYLLVQIHGGCDVRGGYTDAKLLKLQNDYYIHEYLMEWKDSREIECDLEEGYIEQMSDYYDATVVYTSEQIIKRLEEVEIERNKRKRFEDLARLGIVESTNEAGETDIQRIDNPEEFKEENNLWSLPPLLKSDKEAKKLFEEFNNK